jgi:hypothetical protein
MEETAFGYLWRAVAIVFNKQSRTVDKGSASSFICWAGANNSDCKKPACYEIVHKMDGACNMHGEMRSAYKIVIGMPEGK